MGALFMASTAAVLLSGYPIESSGCQGPPPDHPRTADPVGPEVDGPIRIVENRPLWHPARPARTRRSVRSHRWRDRRERAPRISAPRLEDAHTDRHLGERPSGAVARTGEHTIGIYGIDTDRAHRWPSTEPRRQGGNCQHRSGTSASALPAPVALRDGLIAAVDTSWEGLGFWCGLYARWSASGLSLADHEIDTDAGKAGGQELP